MDITGKEQVAHPTHVTISPVPARAPIDEVLSDLTVVTECQLQSHYTSAAHARWQGRGAGILPSVPVPRLRVRPSRSGRSPLHRRAERGKTESTILVRSSGFGESGGLSGSMTQLRPNGIGRRPEQAVRESSEAEMAGVDRSSGLRARARCAGHAGRRRRAPAFSHGDPAHCTVRLPWVRWGGRRSR